MRTSVSSVRAVSARSFFNRSVKASADTSSPEMKRTIYRRSVKLYLVLGGTALFVMCCSMIFTLGPRVIETTGGKLHGVLRSNNEPVEPLAVVQDEPQPSAQLTEKTTVATQPSRETLVMGEDFYTSDFSADDTSTTIIFNVYRGEPEALHIQLEAALNQENVEPPNVWVMCFNSPNRHLYEAVMEMFRAMYPAQSHRLVFTASEFNHKFHGRFLLAYMATTKYVLIVDDDKAIDSTTVFDYIQYMNVKKGVWGNNGHLRAATFEGYKSWPTVGYDLSTTDMAEQDYLCGMWFLEQSWLEYFMKERPPSWATSEDMHLSHVMRKYLNLNTYGGKVALNATRLPRKEYAATKGSALDLREFIFDHQLGRGNKVANVDQPLNSLVYAETVEDIEAFIAKLDACPLIKSFRDSPWCHTGRTAAVFRGAKEQDVNGLISAAEKLCTRTQCEYFSVKPNIRHGIRYFNMRQGYGQASTGVDIPFQTGASDVLLSLVGILNNVLPETVFVPDVASMRWPEATDSARRNRLQIYHRTVLLAVDIHRSSKTNGKVLDGEKKDEWVIADEFPSRMETLIWQRESTDGPVHYYSS